MKKMILLSVLSICMSGAFAQIPAEPDREKFGFRLGGIYSLMNFNKGVPAPTIKAKNIWTPGVDARVILQLFLSKTVRLQPEYAVALMNGKDEQLDASYKLLYMSLPVLARVSVNDRFAILAGPQFDLLIQAKEKADAVQNDITHATEARNISGVIGLEFSFTPAWFIDARWMHGLNHVDLGQRSAVKEFKWRAAGLGVGFRF